MAVFPEPCASEVEKTADILTKITQSAIALFSGLTSILAAIISTRGVSEFSWLPFGIWTLPIFFAVLALVVFLIQVFGRWKSRWVHDNLYDILRGGPDT
jgi:hypothetical protein